MIAAVFLLLTVSGAQADSVDPIEKVLSMLSDLNSKIVREGSDAQKVYDEFAEFCEDRSRNLGFEIKTGKAEVQDLNAAIANENAKAESLTAKIEELASAISTDEADLAAATQIRDKERAAFEAEEKELTDVIGTLERAIQIVSKEMSKSGASMVQLKSALSVAQALSVMVEATSLSSADASKLTALLQSSDEDSSEEFGAPAAASFKSSSGGVVQTMQDLFEKAEGQLEEARKSETKSTQAYQMLAASLKDEIKYANQNFEKAKKDLGASQEGAATAEGDLSVTQKDLDNDVSTLATLHQDCMKGAEDFEAETKSRGEELHALATAAKVITEATSGAADQSYSFLQVARSELSSSVDLANFEAVRFVRNLAQQQKSPALAQLAQRMAQLVRAGSSTSDPFGKIKSLIANMIEKLLQEGQADATEHAFCEKEMAETEAKQTEKEDDIEKLSTKIDSMSAKSAKLKEQSAELEKQLAALAKTQAEADSIRAEEKGAYDTNSAEMEKGVKGVQLALKVLNEYYAKSDKSHSSADGAGSGIIGLLEVCESDFTKGLAEMVSAERTAVSEYDTTSKENSITKATKDQDVKYKTKEAKGLDKEVTEANSDRDGEQTELDAVLQYYKGIQERCIAKPESYADRVKRREAEIAGLKEAMQILEGEAVLLQRGAKHALRGLRVHA